MAKKPIHETIGNSLGKVRDRINAPIYDAEDVIGELSNKEQKTIRKGTGRIRLKVGATVAAATAAASFGIPAAVNFGENVAASGNTASAIDNNITTRVAEVAITDANNAGVTEPSLSVGVTTSPDQGGTGEPTGASAAARLAVQVAQQAKAAEIKEGAPVGPITEYAASQSPTAAAANPKAFLQGAQAAIRKSNQEVKNGIG